MADPTGSSPDVDLGDPIGDWIIGECPGDSGDGAALEDGPGCIALLMASWKRALPVARGESLNGRLVEDLLCFLLLDGLP